MKLQRWHLLLVLVVAIGVTGAWLNSDRIPETRAVEAMHAQGWSEVTIDGKNAFRPGAFGCGGRDKVAFFVHGTNPVGEPTEAIVCCHFRSCTIRN